MESNKLPAGATTGIMMVVVTASQKSIIQQTVIKEGPAFLHVIFHWNCFDIDIADPQRDHVSVFYI